MTGQGELSVSNQTNDSILERAVSGAIISKLSYCHSLQTKTDKYRSDLHLKAFETFGKNNFTGRCSYFIWNISESFSLFWHSTLRFSYLCSRNMATHACCCRTLWKCLCSDDQTVVQLPHQSTARSIGDIYQQNVIKTQSQRTFKLNVKLQCSSSVRIRG